MLTLEHVSKHFGNIKAVDDLSFTIEKGDVVGLLGPNGAGKTTTMRMIASYSLPSAGAIRIGGFDTQTNTRKTQQLIGYLPENNPLYMDMLVIDYLRMTAHLYHMTGKSVEESIKKIAHAVGITDKLGRTIAELSKGYKQRVGIASALLHNPQLIILDEPTEGLDPNQREEIRTLIKGLAKEDKAILISTHVMQEVKAMCSKVIVINNGKLVAQGDPDSLSKHKQFVVTLSGAKGVKIEKITEQLKKMLNKKGEHLHIARKTLTGGEDGYEATITTDREIRPELSKLAGKNNWTIWDTHQQDSLEEVFHNMKEPQS